MAFLFLVPFGSVVLTMKIIGTNKPKLELFFISQDWHTKKRILMQVHVKIRNPQFQIQNRINPKSKIELIPIPHNFALF